MDNLDKLIKEFEDVEPGDLDVLIALKTLFNYMKKAGDSMLSIDNDKIGIDIIKDAISIVDCETHELIAEFVIK